MGIKVTGLKELENKIKAIPNKVDKGCLKAVQFIYKKSQPLVPVDTGKLKKSGSIYKIDGGYGVKYEAYNKEYDYAPIQHEHLGYKHLVGQAKYLEEPIRKNQELIENMVKGEILK